MKLCIFDTNSVSLGLNDSLPEKWKRHWKAVKYGQKCLLLFEQLVYEIYHKNMQDFGKKNDKR